MLKLLLGFIATSVLLRDCGSPNTDQANISSMGFTPADPLPNENTTLWIAYNLKTPITGGTATYSVSFNGIPLTPTVDDLCSQTICPKSIGFYNETSSSLFPDGLSGKIVSKITIPSGQDFDINAVLGLGTNQNIIAKASNTGINMTLSKTEYSEGD